MSPPKSAPATALALLLGLAGQLVAAESHSAPHGPAHVDLWKLANFVLFLGVAVYFLRKPAGAFFSDPHRADPARHRRRRSFPAGS